MSIKGYLKVLAAAGNRLFYGASDLELERQEFAGSSSKYRPHHGVQEKARRMKQINDGVLQASLSWDTREVEHVRDRRMH